jgi:hypothetical protein
MDRLWTSHSHSADLELGTVPHGLAKSIELLSNYGFRCGQRSRDANVNWIYMERYRSGMDKDLRLRAKISWPRG